MLILACLFFLWQENPMPETGSPDDEAPPETSVQPLEEATRQVTVAAVGDIMVHQTQYVRAYDPQADGYDFRPSFEVIAPYLQEADLIVGNLETTLGGEKLGLALTPVLTVPTRSLRHCGRRDSTCCAQPTTIAWIKVNRVCTVLLRSWSRRG